jgi:hypothetical protein
MLLKDPVQTSHQRMSRTKTRTRTHGSGTSYGRSSCFRPLYRRHRLVLVYADPTVRWWNTRRFQDDKRTKLLTQLQIDNRNECLWEDAFTKGDILKIQGRKRTQRTDWFSYTKRRAYSDLTRISGSAYKTVVIRKPDQSIRATYEGDINLHSQLDASGGSINGRVINMSTQVSISVS